MSPRVIVVGITIETVTVRQHHHLVTYDGHRVDRDAVASIITARHRQGRLVDGHKAETHGHIGYATREGDIADHLIGIGRRYAITVSVVTEMYFHILDAAHVGHLAVGIDDVDVGCRIGHKEQPVLPIIIDLGDQTIRKLILLGQSDRLQRGLVELEQMSTVQIIDLITRVVDILNLGIHIVVMQLPSARIGCSKCQRYKRQQ